MLKHYFHLLLIALASFAGNAAHAQNTIFNFSRSPEFLEQSPLVKFYAVPADSILNVTYRDTISPEASWLKKAAFTINRNDLHTFMASNTMPAGHYVYTLLDRNNVYVYKFHKPSFQVYFINLGYMSLVEITDMNNHNDSGVVVKLGKQILHYDKMLKAFPVPSLSMMDTLVVSRGNDICYYNISAYVNTPYREYQRDYYNGQPLKFGGYMVTNKPKYLPGDTIKWKAYIVNEKTGKPINEVLELSLNEQMQYFETKPQYLIDEEKEDKEKKSKLRKLFKMKKKNSDENEEDEDDEEDEEEDEEEEDDYESYRNYLIWDHKYDTKYTINSAIKPVQPGVYFSEFVVADSMDISRLYNLILTSKKGLRLHTQLYLEDYLLNDLRVKVKSDAITTYQPGDSIHVYAYASTANNLPLMDGTVSVTLMPNSTYRDHKRVFPDTLFHRQMPIDPSGETVFTIPTDSFAKYTTGLYCHIRVLSSNNERKDTSIYMELRTEPYLIRSKQEGNILKVDMIKNNKSVKAYGYYIKNYDTAKYIVNYPATVAINAFDHRIAFYPDSIFGNPAQIVHSRELDDDKLTATDDYQKDTAFLSISNSQKAFIRFAIYNGNQFAGIGYTSGDTTLKVVTKNSETVTIKAYYNWRGPRQKNFIIYKYDKDINIDVHKKDLVYPGEKDNISVRLTDIEGQPFYKTNFTVLAFNNQFVEDFVPQLPYSGKLRTGFNNDTSRQLNELNMPTMSFKLTDRRWVRIAGADTSFLYQQILQNPKNNTWLRYRMRGTQQMSVHIQEKGVYNIPEIIYVDSRPVFYKPVNLNTASNNNGFYVSAGWHHIMVRTKGYLYTINSVHVPENTGLTLMINGDLDMPASVTKYKMNDSLGYDEQENLSRAYILVRPDYRNNLVTNFDPYGYSVPDYSIEQRRDYRKYMNGTSLYFQQMPHTFVLTQQYNYGYAYGSGSYNNQYNGVSLAGPFESGKPITFYQFNNTKQTFNFESNQIFSFREGMIRVEREDIKKYFPKLQSVEYWPDFRYEVPKYGDADTFVVRLKPDTLAPKFVVTQQRTIRAGADSIGLIIRVADYNNQPLIGAYLNLRNKTTWVTTEPTRYEERIRVPELKAGTYDIEIVFRNVRTKIPGKVKVYKDSTTYLTLKINSYQARDEHSAYYKQPLLSDRGRMNSSFDAQDIRHAPTRDMTSLVATSAGMINGRSNDINAGGGRNGNTIIMLDGMMIRGAVPNIPQATLGEIAAPEESATEFLASGKTQAFIAQFMANQLIAAGLRSNFRDYAIWEPNLWTDKNGEAHFTVTYPDNITGWKTYVLAMNEKGFSGKALRITNAFKPLSAQLSVPRFLRYGDTVTGIGKISNYTKEVFSLQSNFLQNGKELAGERLTVNNIKIAQLEIAAPVRNSTDTANITATYSIKTDNGYMDGEEKKIPVYFTGTTESSGLFAVLSRDTTVYSKPDSSKAFTGTSYIMVDGSLLDVMLREIEHLKVYPYGCVEQLTTKLLAISYEEEVKRILGVDTVNNAVARDSIIMQLVKKQNYNGSFGWWNPNSADVRITNYVINTMARINKDHKLDIVIKQGLTYLANSLVTQDKYYYLQSLRTLSDNKMNLNYELLLKRINDSLLSQHDSFIVVSIRKEQGLPYREWLDTLVKHANTQNGLSWGRRGYDWYNNDLATTLLAYKLVENDSLYSPMKDGIMQYLLHKRRSGYYANTAESGQVLTAILPGMMANTSSVIRDKHTSVVINGTINKTLTNFPVRMISQEKNIALSFSKTGIGPAYVSVVYNYLKEDPEVKDDLYKVSTHFIDGTDTVEQLKAGGLVTLRVTVTCDTATDYVMIEVPIPAGCVQATNTQYAGYYETNRDNFKDKTVIYCSNLNKSTYTFDVPLEVRYKGSFNMNPARVSMMYYAEKYGNNKVKRVRIK